MSDHLEEFPSRIEAVECLIKLGRESAHIDQLCRELEGYRSQEQEARERKSEIKWHIVGTIGALIVSIIATLITIQLLG